jgi:hypothetical protein
MIPGVASHLLMSMLLAAKKQKNALEYEIWRNKINPDTVTRNKNEKVYIIMSTSSPYALGPS